MNEDCCSVYAHNCECVPVQFTTTMATTGPFVLDDKDSAILETEPQRAEDPLSYLKHLAMVGRKNCFFCNRKRRAGEGSSGRGGHLLQVVDGKGKGKFQMLNFKYFLSLVQKTVFRITILCDLRICTI